MSARESFTMKHMLLDCKDLQDILQKFFTASSLKDIFEVKCVIAIGDGYVKLFRRHIMKAHVARVTVF